MHRRKKQSKNRYVYWKSYGCNVLELPKNYRQLQEVIMRYYWTVRMTKWHNAPLHKSFIAMEKLHEIGFLEFGTVRLIFVGGLKN